MSRYFYFLLAASVAGMSFTAFWLGPETDWSRHGLKGNVSYTRERIYSVVIKDGIPRRGDQFHDDSLDRSVAIWFDRDGNYSSRKYYDQNDRLREQRYFRYNDKRLLVCDCTVYRNGAYMEFDNYAYNPSGQVISQVRTRLWPDWGKEIWVQHYFKYDNTGRKIAEQCIDSLHPEWSFEKMWSYNALGQIANWEEKKPDGAHYKWRCEYDNTGNLLRQYEPHAIGHASIEYHWFYENKKYPRHLTSEIFYKDGKEFSYQRYQYFDSGKLWKEESYRDTSRTLSSLIIYNEQGDITEINYYYDSALTKSKHFTYEYDAQGNWISELTYIDGEPKGIIEREIAYY